MCRYNQFCRLDYKYIKHYWHTEMNAYVRMYAFLIIEDEDFSILLNALEGLCL